MIKKKQKQKKIECFEEIDWGRKQVYQANIGVNVREKKVEVVIQKFNFIAGCNFLSGSFVAEQLV